MERDRNRERRKGRKMERIIDIKRERIKCMEAKQTNNNSKIERQWKEDKVRRKLE
jgi:hypothetical protein